MSRVSAHLPNVLLHANSFPRGYDDEMKSKFKLDYRLGMPDYSDPRGRARTPRRPSRA